MCIFEGEKVDLKCTIDNMSQMNCNGRLYYDFRHLGTFFSCCRTKKGSAVSTSLCFCSSLFSVSSAKLRSNMELHQEKPPVASDCNTCLFPLFSK